jgi:hypothetical protein
MMTKSLTGGSGVGWLPRRGPQLMGIVEGMHSSKDEFSTQWKLREI